MLVLLVVQRKRVLYSWLVTSVERYTMVLVHLVLESERNRWQSCTSVSASSASNEINHYVVRPRPHTWADVGLALLLCRTLGRHHL